MRQDEWTGYFRTEGEWAAHSGTDGLRALVTKCTKDDEVEEVKPVPTEGFTTQKAHSLTFR